MKFVSYEYFSYKIKALHTREGNQLEEDYEQHVHRFAKEGWRFVQFIDLTNLHPKDPHIALLFEREKGGR